MRRRTTPLETAIFKLKQYHCMTPRRKWYGYLTPVEVLALYKAWIIEKADYWTRERVLILKKHGDCAPFWFWFTMKKNKNLGLMQEDKRHGEHGTKIR